MRELGWKPCVIAARTRPSARRAVRFIGGGTPRAGVSQASSAASVVLIATPDDAISAVAEELARVEGAGLKGKVVLHTSGALDSQALAALKTCGAACGSMHPLQTFSGVGVPPLEGCVFGIEGDAAAVRKARQIVRALGGVPFVIPARKKLLYHAAAVLAAGHILTMEEAAVRTLMSTGLSRRLATHALLPLTRQVLNHYEELGPRKAWTGPLARGDYRVIAAHGAALCDGDTAVLDAYQAVSRLGARLLAADSENALRELEKIFAQLQTGKESKGGPA